MFATSLGAWSPLDFPGKLTKKVSTILLCLLISFIPFNMFANIFPSFYSPSESNSKSTTSANSIYFHWTRCNIPRCNICPTCLAVINFPKNKKGNRHTKKVKLFETNSKYKDATVPAKKCRLT